MSILLALITCCRRLACSLWLRLQLVRCLLFLSDCSPCSQLRTILFWIELLHSILLFMFVLGHFLLLGPLTCFGSKVLPFFVLWESLVTRSPFGTCQRLSANGPFLPSVGSWSFSFTWSSVAFGSKVFPFFVLRDSLATRSPFGMRQQLPACGPLA